MSEEGADRVSVYMLCQPRGGGGRQAYALSRLGWLPILLSVCDLSGAFYS